MLLLWMIWMKGNDGPVIVHIPWWYIAIGVGTAALSGILSYRYQLAAQEKQE